jgi:hypothetical protein
MGKLNPELTSAGIVKLGTSCVCAIHGEVKWLHQLPIRFISRHARLCDMLKQYY